jgi:hypothetical protein
MIGHIPCAAPSGPVGCRAAIITIAVVVVLVTAFVIGIGWALRDMGAN